MRKLFLYPLLIFNILLSPITAAAERVDQIVQNISTISRQINESSIELSRLKVQLNKMARRNVAEYGSIFEDIKQLEEILRTLREEIDACYHNYEGMTGFPFVTNSQIPNSTYTPNEDNLNPGLRIISGALGKFTTTCAGLPNYKRPEQRPEDSEQTKNINELKTKIHNEKRRLIELNELLKLPEYQDTTCLNTKKLLSKIEESTLIVNYFEECLQKYQQSEKSEQSLKRLLSEARQNCILPVKLVLHKDGFSVPKLVKYK